MTDDLLATVEAKLAKANDPSREDECVTNAVSYAEDDDGHPDVVTITWDEIRALVARCREAEAQLAEAVEAAFREGIAIDRSRFWESSRVDAAWLSSEARKAVGHD